MPHQGSYINGAWVTGAGKVQRNLHPADLAEVVAEFPTARSADALAAIATQTVRNLLLFHRGEPLEAIVGG